MKRHVAQHTTRPGTRPAAIRIAVLCSAMALGATTAGAQGVELLGGVSASTQRVSRVGGATSVLTGPVLGASGGVRVRRFAIEASYLEGSLSAESGSVAGDETFAEASVVASAELFRGFSVGAGPRARAFIAPGGRVRWMRIEGRARYSSEVIPGRARADFELWQVLSGDVNAQGGSDGGRGGSAGLTVALPNSRFALRLAYTADRVAFVSGASEFVDGVQLGLRIGRF